MLGIKISHPEKVMWPAEDRAAVTKLDLAHYLEEVGEWMLKHVAGRPCSVIRAPDGIKGEMFFQRHAMKGMSPDDRLVRVSGDREPYIEANSVEALIGLGQIAVARISSMELRRARSRFRGPPHLRPRPRARC